MGNKELLIYSPTSISAPGETIKELIEELGMNQIEFSDRLGLHKKTVNEIIKGKAPITSETALLLEKVLNVPATFWNNREQKYREYLARKEEYKKLEVETKWLKKLPLKQMIDYKWINKKVDKVDQLIEVLSFYGVASTYEWKKLWLEPHASYRISLASANYPEAISAWLRYGEVQAKQHLHIPYNESLFRKNLVQIKKLILSEEDCKNKLKELCLEAGVILVCTPILPKAKISGAVRWVGNNPILQLSNRYKYHDRFWFTFFHEAGHILLHGKKDYFVEGVDQIKSTNVKEKEADEFASEMLVPEISYQQFKQMNQFDEESIKTFAAEMKIHPGIIVGRLQHEKILKYYQLKELQKKFEIEMD